MYMVSFFAYLSLIRKKHDIFQTNNTQAAENICRNNVGCNIYKFASKGENWVYKKVCKKKWLVNALFPEQKLRRQEFFWGSSRPNGRDKFHFLNVHFECASNKIHISSTILRCRWWNWNFSSTTAALYSWLVTLSGPRSSILASYRETSVQPRQP